MGIGLAMLIGALLSLVGTIGTGVINARNQKKLQESQQDMTQDNMVLQQKLNEQSAENAARRDENFYTNFQSPQAMVKQYEAAGLNPALMYQNGGTVGQSTIHGFQAGSVSNPGVGGISSNPFSTPDLAGAVANTRLANAQADEAEAKAREIEGETPKAQAEIQKLNEEVTNLAQQTENEKVKNSLLELDARYAKLRNAFTEITMQDRIAELHWRAEEVFEGWREKKIWNEINQSGKATLIKQFDANYNLTLAKTFHENAQGKVSMEQCQLVTNQARLTLSQIASEKIKQTDYGKNWHFKSQELKIADKRLSTELEKAHINKEALIWMSGISAGGNAVGNILRFVGTKGKALPTDQGGNTLGGGLEWVPMIGENWVND